MVDNFVNLAEIFKSVVSGCLRMVVPLYYELVEDSTLLNLKVRGYAGDEGQLVQLCHGNALRFSH